MFKNKKNRMFRGSPDGRHKSISSKIYFLTKLAFVGVIIGILILVISFPLIALDLPSPEKIIRHEGFSTKIVDRNGKVLYDIYTNEKRIPVKVEDIPEYLKLATVSIEDKNFYQHQGFDPIGIIRGLSRAITRGRAQGGSTLTQQLVKNVLLTSERSVLRKLKEFVLAVQIERKYTKDEILLMYLNEAPYGGTAWGVEAASETYFGKNVRDLNLIESAILAGLPQRPSYYTPYGTTPDAYKGRTEDVLRRMREDGHISKVQEDEALKMLESIEFVGKGANFEAPHFVQYVQNILEDKYGSDIIERGGLKVTTTLDLDLQNEAQKVVTEEIQKVENFHITNGAAVVLNPQTGEILAMVGSKDFLAKDYDGQVNVTLSLRQPGSAIKPITYITALMENYTASTLLMDVATEFPGGVNQPNYKPVNYDGKFKGPIQVRYALANSINVPAVKMLAMVGIKDALKTAYELGIKSLEPTDETLSRVGLSLTLGGGEVRLLDLTGAYSAFMNKGYRIDPVAILKVEDRDGKVLEKIDPKKGNRVLEESEAFIIASILSDNEARSAVFGLNSLLNLPGKNVAVKTGTTNDKKDNWTIGGNSNVIVGVWVGNNDNTSMKQVASGISGASPIWHRIILKALEGKPNVSFEVPSDIVTAAVDKISGYKEHDGFPSRIEYFKKGTVPGEDSVHVKLKVCKNDGKLATPSDIAGGNYDEKEYLSFKEEDATGGIDGINKWQEGILAWIAGQNNPMYNPPTEYCGSGNPVNVQIVSPEDHSNNLPGNFNFEAKASSTSNIVEVKFEVDGSKLITFVSPPYKQDVNLNDGIHELKVVAKDEKGNESDRTIKIGVGVPWDYSPTPVPTATSTPTPSPSPTP
ncbi:MAG TPA: PBP1A family penicillin-binding protein [Patescibacteria group bacterium]|nr:PBP1A family penicillin-binding protein [Patescibacteria group bacterium]